MHTSDAAIHLAFVDATFSLSFSLIFCFEPHTHSSIYTRRLSHLLRWQSLDNICALSAQKRSDTLRKKKKLNNYFFHALALLVVTFWLLPLPSRVPTENFFSFFFHFGQQALHHKQLNNHCVWSEKKAHSRTVSISLRKMSNVLLIFIYGRCVALFDAAMYFILNCV